MPQRNQSAASKNRRERERVEMISRIKEIAREMFVRNGYDAVTLQGIADALEYTAPAIYRYFKDKKELLSAIVLEDMEDLHAKLLECARLENPLERLMEMARQNALWAANHPNHYLLFYSPAWREREDAVRMEANRPLKQEPLFEVYRAVEELIERGMLKKEFHDPPLAARTLLAGIHGVIMLEITMSGYDKSLIHDDKRPVLERLEAMVNALLRGILNP